MSLINQMLQDIERRESGARSTTAEGLGFQSYAAVQQPQPSWRLPALLGLGALSVLAVGAGVWSLVPVPSAPSLKVVAAAAVPASPASQAPSTSAPSPVPVQPVQPVQHVLSGLSSPLAPAPPPARAEKEPPKAARTVPPRAELPVAGVTAAAKPATPASSPGKAAVPAPGLSRAEQLYQQALGQSKQGQADQAQKSLREALEIQPQHVEARLALARLLVDRAQSNAAAELLADGVMLLPRQASFALALAPLWFQSGQQDDALALLAQQAKTASNNPQFHAYYASQLLRLKRHADAAAQYRAALRDDPGAVDWLLGLGISLQGAGNNKEALETFRRAYETGKLSPEKRDLVEQMIAGLKTKVVP